jgi:hypothetical protein
MLVLLLKLLLLQQLQLLMRLLVMMLLSRVRVELGRSGVRVRVKLIGGWWRRAGIEDNNMALFKVLNESMKVLKVDAAACVVAAELIFAFHGRERVENRATVRLYGGGDLSCTAEVGGVQGTKELSRRGSWRRTVTERSWAP